MKVILVIPQPHKADATLHQIPEASRKRGRTFHTVLTVAGTVTPWLVAEFQPQCLAVASRSQTPCESHNAPKCAFPGEDQETQHGEELKQVFTAKIQEMSR